ncbi:MAG TPA: GrpB family protein [Rhizomicrobium sp.]|jgi:GrpB-like predicted nucleotidyltransferase (UPF0157 family)|nr:GrpB family protein [Rhizomicrobium sp.]
MGRPVIVVDYDPAWPQIYERLRAPLAAALGDCVATIEHVGSTAVPGLAAKPVIDIDAALVRACALPQAIERLAPLGYEHEGDLGIPGRHAFRHAAALPVHHLYVCLPDCIDYHRHIVFRDRLRIHPEEAAAYGNLKRELAMTFRDDRDGYTRAKSAFVEAILARARESGA